MDSFVLREWHEGLTQSCGNCVKLSCRDGCGTVCVLLGPEEGNFLLPSGSRQGVSFLLFPVKSLTWTYQKILNANVGGVAA